MSRGGRVCKHMEAGLTSGRRPAEVCGSAVVVKIQPQW